jgi:hypothetical protein
MRVMLMVRLLHRSNFKRIADWVADLTTRAKAEPISDFGRLLMQRLINQ